MMRPTVRLAAAALRHPNGSLLLVAAVIALAGAALTAAMVVRTEAAVTVDEAFSSAHGPDLVVTVAAGSGEAAASVLRAEPSVSAVDGPRATIDAQVRSGGDEYEYEIRALGEGRADVNEPVLVEGRRPVAPGEILADAAVAQGGGPGVGDTVAVSTSTGPVPLAVVGLAYDFTDCFHPTCDPARGWVTGAGLAAITAAHGAELLAVDMAATATDADVEAVTARLDSVLGSTLLGHNTWADTRGDLLVITDFYGAFLGAFGLFVALSAGVVIAGTITARTVARRRAIAVQKAVGCTSAQLAGALLLEHLVMAVVGCAAGSLVAALVAPRLRVGALAVLDHGSVALAAGDLIVSGAVVLTLVAAATVLPAWRSARTTVVDGLTPGDGLGRVASVAARVGAGRRPTSLVLGVRSAMARPARSLLGAGAIALAIVAAVVATSINRTVDRVLAEPALAGNPSDVTVAFPDDVAPSEAAAALDGVDAVSGWYSLADDSVEVDGFPVHLRAVGGDPSDAGFVIGEGRPLAAPGEAIAGYGLLSDMGWELGDRLTIGDGDRTVTVTLVGWYRETEDSGAVLQVRAEDHARLDPAARPGRYGVTGTAATSPGRLAAVLAAELGPGATITPTRSDGAETEPFRDALRAMSVLLAAVAGAHLVASVVTTSREQRRRTGALRSVGVTATGSIVEVVARTSVVLVVAVTAGLVVGRIALQVLGDVLTSELGAGPGLSIGPTPLQYVGIGLGASLLTVAVAVLATLPEQRRTAADLVRAD